MTFRKASKMVDDIRSTASCNEFDYPISEDELGTIIAAMNTALTVLEKHRARIADGEWGDQYAEV